MILFFLSNDLKKKYGEKIKKEGFI